MKKTLTALTLSVCCVASLSANAARYCYSYVDSIRITSTGATVFTSSSWNNARQDPMTLSFQDSAFTKYLQKLSQAQASNSEVKIYILEEFDGDDGRRCDDGITDYIGSVH